MLKTVFVAGHQGMVGRALCKRLIREPGAQLITRERSELDLMDQDAVKRFFAEEPIDEVYLAAAKVGGIHANNAYPAEFIHNNLAIQNNVIHEAYEAGVKKLLFLGSSCIYPRNAHQPMSEVQLLTGVLEATNEPYAIAKIAGIKMCESYNRQYGVDFRSVMPTNLYGENDNFHPDNSHVIPGMMNRFHDAKINRASSVTVWGSGTPKREFLHVDDMADACCFVMGLPHKQFSSMVDERCSHINVGTGRDCSIRELAETMCDAIGYAGQLVFDTSKPDGTPRKLLDVSRLTELGWSSSIGLDSGLAATYDWFSQHVSQLRGLGQ